jgi:hypothetical protein
MTHHYTSQTAMPHRQLVVRKIKMEVFRQVEAAFKMSVLTITLHNVNMPGSNFSAPVKII